MLASGRGCRVLAELPEGSEDSADSFLEGEFSVFHSYGGAISKDVERMLAVFDFIASRGRQQAARLFHEANKDTHIYEFTKGDLRVYFAFMTELGQICLCSHSIRKKRTKAASSDIHRAVAVRERFLAAQRSGSLQIVERKRGDRI